MVHLLIATIVLSALPPAAAPVTALAPATRCEALIARLDVAAPFAPVLADLCARAPTFRRQIVRLASEGSLEVSVVPGVFTPGGRARARTAMTKVAGQLRRAVVEVPQTDPRVLAELVAHEFEHIVEQLDRVDLAAWAGRSGVYRVGGSAGDGPFETERARQVGRLVAGEFLTADVAIAARRTG